MSATRDRDIQIDDRGNAYVLHKGTKVFIADDGESEAADGVICALASDSAFSDNILTVCAGCGVDICHRPYAPETPPKVCLRCAVARILERQEVRS